MAGIHYFINRSIRPDQFISLLQKTSLATRRPIDDIDRITSMLAHTNLLITAWQDSALVGAARSVTDFSYCCYLSDLAVDEQFQRQGIGRQLVTRTLAQLQLGCRLILLSAPQARDYYPHVGFEQHDSAWTTVNTTATEL